MPAGNIPNDITMLRPMARLKDLLEKQNVIGCDGVIAETYDTSEMENTVLRANQIASLLP